MKTRYFSSLVVVDSLSHPNLKVGDSCRGGFETRPYTMRGAFGTCYAMSR